MINENWSTTRGNNARTGFVDISQHEEKEYLILFLSHNYQGKSCLRALNGNGKLQWQKNLEAVSGEHDLIAAQDRIITCSDKISCLDINGNEIWDHKEKGVFQNPIYSGGTILVVSHPGPHEVSIIGMDLDGKKIFEVPIRTEYRITDSFLSIKEGVIYCSINGMLEYYDPEHSSLKVQESTGELTKINSDHRIEWRKKAGSERPSMQFGATIANKDLIVVPREHWVGDGNELLEQESFLECYNLDGSLKWRYDTRESRFSGVPSCLEDLVIIETSDGTVHMLDTEGKLLSKEKYPCLNGACAMDKDLSVFGTYIYGTVHAIDKKGKILWEYKTEGNADNPPAIFDDHILIRVEDQWCTGNFFYCFDKSGKVRWKFQLDHLYDSAPVVIGYNK